jgi:hypothetical protein
MPCRVCPRCRTRWPNEEDRYGTCPECHEVTAYRSSWDAIDLEEAEGRRKHAEFERYYRLRDAAKLERETGLA